MSDSGFGNRKSSEHFSCAADSVDRFSGDAETGDEHPRTLSRCRRDARQTGCADTVPAIEKIEKTDEVHHLQFSDQAVRVPFGMKDGCVQFIRTEDLEAHTDPAHRHDRCCFRVAATIASDSEVEESVEVPQVERTTHACDSDVQKTVEFPPSQL